MISAQKVALNTYRHGAISALPAGGSARRIREFLVQDTECGDALTCILLLAHATILTRRNLLVRILEVAT